MELSVNEVSGIHVAIEFKFTFSSLLTVNKISRVDDLIVIPLLSSLAVICVILPLALVHGALLVNEDTIATGFALFPLTLVYVAVGVSHATFAMEKTALGHALVFGAIWELDDAETLPNLLLLLVVPGDGPLATVLASLVDVDDSGVPEEALASALRPGAQLIGDLVIRQQHLISLDYLAVRVTWLLLACDRLHLHKFFESSPSDGSSRPLFNDLNLLHGNNIFSELDSLVCRGSAATHIFKII
jgi:hypothetical protein